jgi:hypothetical protein
MLPEMESTVVIMHRRYATFPLYATEKTANHLAHMMRPGNGRDNALMHTVRDI